MNKGKCWVAYAPDGTIDGFFNRKADAEKHAAQTGGRAESQTVYFCDEAVMLKAPQEAKKDINYF